MAPDRGTAAVAQDFGSERGKGSGAFRIVVSAPLIPVIIDSCHTSVRPHRPLHSRVPAVWCLRLRIAAGRAGMHP